MVSIALHLARGPTGCCERWDVDLVSEFLSRWERPSARGPQTCGEGISRAGQSTERPTGCRRWFDPVRQMKMKVSVDSPRLVHGLATSRHRLRGWLRRRAPGSAFTLPSADRHPGACRMLPPGEWAATQDRTLPTSDDNAHTGRGYFFKAKAIRPVGPD